MTAPIGTHCILELHDCPAAPLNDEPFIRRAIAEASRRSLSTLLRITSRSFEPQGVTAVGLLAESHVSIHTWPELGYAAVDIFTCGEGSRPDLACEYMVGRFAARRHSITSLQRGASLESARIQPPRRSTHSSAANPPEEADLCRAPS